jgi:hypothetical protein
VDEILDKEFKRMIFLKINDVGTHLKSQLLRRQKQEDYEFEASQGKVSKTLSQKQK